VRRLAALGDGGRLGRRLLGLGRARLGLEALGAVLGLRLLGGFLGLGEGGGRLRRLLAGGGRRRLVAGELGQALRAVRLLSAEDSADLRELGPEGRGSCRRTSGSRIRAAGPPRCR
jgi:hypothetical protein